MQTEKVTAAAKKLHAHAHTLWSHTARLRPYGDKLRQHAVRAVDAAGSWLHRGIVQIGRVSPRTAKRLEAAEAWVCRSDARKLCAAGLVAVVLGAGFAAIFSDTAGRYGRVIFASNRVVPLPDEIRRTSAEKAKQLAAALDARIDRKGKFAGEAWISAQVLVALKENDDSIRIGAKSIERYFRSVEGPECACWRRLPRGEFPNHVGVTSWVLWTLARYGMPAQRGEIEFLLSTQDRDGGWPLFAGAQQEKFASSYGTAAAILALHEQSTLKANRAQQAQLAAAAQRGADWLKSRVAPGRARWADYPAWPEARKELLAISGFALFALHRVGAPDLAALDRDWLRQLPAEAPAALRSETSSGRMVQIGKRSYRDDTRHYALPWTILATAAAYPNASISEKVRVMEWLERALAPEASIHALTGKERNAAIAAEALLALRSEALRE